MASHALIACEGDDHGVEIDYLRPHENGLLVPRSVAMLAAAIERLMDEAGLLQRLSEGAVASADGMSIDSLVAANDAAYRRVWPLTVGGGRGRMQRVIAAYRAFLSAVVPERHMVRGFIARHLGSRDAEGLCLDIGAGTAPFAAALRQALPKARYVAIDRIPSEPVDLIADATSLPLPTGSASLACFFQVLSHVPDMAGALAEVRRTLAPDGQILIVYPFLIPECRSRDLWRWTMPGMERLLDEAGFDIVAHEPQGGILSWLTGMLAVLPGSLLIAHRAGWRSGRGPIDSLRLGLALLLSLPFHLLGFAAWSLDRMLDRKPVFYIGAMVLARRRHVSA